MTTELTIVEQEQDFGPAMLALPENRRRFVLSVLLTGGRNGAEAARMAGYSEHSATATASQLMRDEKVLAAIREEAERRLKSAAAMAVETLVQICGDQMNKDRFKAAARILDFAGLAPKSEHTIKVEHTNLDRRGQLLEVKQLALELGLDARDMLRKAGLEVIDAEFTEVFPDAAKPEDDLGDIYA